MRPTATQTVADIHNRALKLLAKPMPPSVANTQRMTIRRAKRTITWVFLNPREVWMDCGMSCPIRWMGVTRASDEVVAAHRFIELTGGGRHCRDAGAGNRGALLAGADESPQDRNRQVGVMGFDRLVEPFRHLALA